MNLTDDQRWLMDHCIECDGAEIPEPWWDDAEVLVSAGFATLSGPRGPGGGFKRIEPITAPIYSAEEDQ